MRRAGNVRAFGDWHKRQWDKGLKVVGSVRREPHFTHPYRSGGCTDRSGSWGGVRRARSLYHKELPGIASKKKERRKGVGRRAVLSVAGRGDRVYAIYDNFPKHVDPRPSGNTDRFITHYANWT